jgi:uncharacterized protein YdeI (YjbR/CyaY-like superfamily)
MAKRTMLLVIGRDEWRAWLEENHDTQTEVWLVFLKRHTGRRSIAYEDAVEEALCVGWVDSLVRRIDDETYARKFTPRRMTSKWSALNLRRVAKLVPDGRMTPAGMAKITSPLPDADRRAPEPQPLSHGGRRQEKLAPKMERMLRANSTASRNFRKLAPSYRRTYVRWVMSAKREETRERRFRELLDVLSRGEKLGMK